MEIMQRTTTQRVEKGGLPATLVILMLGIFSLPAAAQYEEPEAPPPCPTPYVKTISPRAAQPLTEVKIRGSRFGDEPGSVTFSPAIEGKVVSWSYKRIYVEVPEGAQPGPVTVTSPCGSVSNGEYFMVEDRKDEDPDQQDNPWEAEEQKLDDEEF